MSTDPTHPVTHDRPGGGAARRDDLARDVARLWAAGGPAAARALADANLDLAVALGDLAAAYGVRPSWAPPGWRGID